MYIFDEMFGYSQWLVYDIALFYCNKALKSVQWAMVRVQRRIYFYTLFSSYETEKTYNTNDVGQNSISLSIKSFCILTIRLLLAVIKTIE